MSDRYSGTDGYASAQSTPYPNANPLLSPPRPLPSDLGTPRESYMTNDINYSNQMLSQPGNEKYMPTEPRRGKKRFWLYALIALIAIGIIVVAVVVPVYFTVIKPRQHNNLASTDPNAGNTGSTGENNGGNNEPSKPTEPTVLITGGDGTEITMEDGTKFTYNSSFGGIWYSDPKDPFNTNAQPNSWTPPLNTSWDYNKNRINGVNLGGLFVLEPFIAPALFQKYPTASDEWSLSTLMAADTAGGGLDQLDDHYKTFITEQDIAEIAGAGLNWVRLPVPFWAIETWPGEPFLAKKSWPQILKVIEWCRKYGIRVKLDLHTIPGSQNGYNHSGKGGQVNFLAGAMGVANAQRALNYIRIFTEFFSQPQYKDVVVMFGIVNEALVSTIGKESIMSFYNEAYGIIRDITGTGAGKGFFMSVHDGFQGTASWAGDFDGADRVNLDSHPYFTFDGSPNDDPISSGTTPATAGGVWPKNACDRWAQAFNASRDGFGVTIAGEWSNGFNDCGLFLLGAQNTGHNYPGDCAPWQDSSNWSAAIKAGLKEFSLAQMDSFRDYFFWTWKIGNSNKGYPESPLWSYKLGLENGWMPKDPREAIGKCASVGVTGNSWDGTYKPFATGGAGAGPLLNSAQHPWPPATIRSVAGGQAAATLLPSYVPTGTVVTLPPVTFASPTATDGVGSGWFNEQDKALAPTPESGCKYPDPWDARDSPVPAIICGTNAGPTPAP